MGRPLKLTKEQVATALVENDGFIATTAKALGVAYDTVSDMIKRYPDLQKLVAAERKASIEALGKSAYKRAMDGDTALTIFLLKTLGRDEGYTERQEIATDGALTIRIVHDDDPSE